MVGEGAVETAEAVELVLLEADGVANEGIASHAVLRDVKSYATIVSVAENPLPFWGSRRFPAVRFVKV